MRRSSGTWACTDEWMDGWMDRLMKWVSLRKGPLTTYFVSRRPGRGSGTKGQRYIASVSMDQWMDGWMGGWGEGVSHGRSVWVRVPYLGTQHEVNRRSSSHAPRDPEDPEDPESTGTPD